MWKKIPFHELPGWLRQQWDPHNFRINKKLVKVYHGDNHSFKVLHIRDKKGKIHTHCWRKYDSKVKSRSQSVVPAILIVMLCIAGVLLVVQPGILSNFVPNLEQVILPQNNYSESLAASSNLEYTGIFKRGNIATDSSGVEGMAIISNNYEGQYYVQKVYLETSRKGWYSKGITAAEWVPYSKVESQYPIAWSGGIMDTTHIPDRDWTLSTEQNSNPPVDQTITEYPLTSVSTISQGAVQGLNINEIEHQILSLTNNERSNNGVAPLIWDDRLALVARDHSEDMAQNSYIDHINLQGEDPTARAIRHGYSVHKEIGGGWYSEGIGENIAEMPTGRVMLTCPSEDAYVQNSAFGVANAMMDAWMNHDNCQADGHRKNILNSQYSHIGIGVAYDGTYYIATQDFW
jgi:uncharacterized protein YkwD